MKIVHIITGLNVGGAEVMLRELLGQSGTLGAQSCVISLTDCGPIGREIEAMGVRVLTLNMKRGLPSAGGVFRLARLLRRLRPDVVQTWLYHADLIGGLAARLAGIRALVWGLHISFLDAPQSKKTTLLTVRAGAKLSHFLPRKIICCAHSTQQLHVDIGYAREKMVTIPNGFDLHRFRPDTNARCTVRQELGLDEQIALIGLLGRFHPQKDHQNFVRAAKILSHKRPDVNFLLAGEGSEWKNPELARWIGEAGLQRRFHLLGRRADTSQIYPALDLLALSSTYGEAFPLVVGEAMCCGVPCVVTNVGDAALMVGGMGRVVAPKDPHALAEAWGEVLDLAPEEHCKLGRAARQHIAQHYEIGAIAGRYHALYREVKES